MYNKGTIKTEKRMKKSLLFGIVMVLLGVGTLQAQSINYQAVVRNASGNLVTNQAVGVQLAILEGSITGTAVYTETHNVTSNAYGIIQLKIGSGTTTGNFGTIDWSNQNKWVKIGVDISGGTTYADMGTSKLQQVPYALYAAKAPNELPAGGTNGQVLKTDGSGNYAWVSQTSSPFTTTGTVTSNATQTYTTNDFVFGSFQLNANGSYNHGYNSRMFFDKSKAAFRAGYTQQNQWDESNVGDYSVGFGEGGLASGRNSFSMGRNANATGNEAFAFGTNAGGFADFAKGFGVNARAFGVGATAIGVDLSANSMGEVQLGQYSTYVNGNKTAWVATDRLFVIGNGQYEINNALDSDALVMLKNGNTTLNGKLTLDADNKASGRGYTFPGQDGTVNQIMSTDGAGNLAWVTPAASAIPNGGSNGQVLATNGSGGLSWVSNDILPSGGTSGYVLTTNGSGGYSWVSKDDADADATNEIELPTGGTSGQVLSTNGSGVYSWVNQPSLPVTVFSTVNNVTSNAPGTIATDDFVFGSTQLTNIQGAADNHRMFFDKSHAAFRAGNATDNNTGFNTANLGPYSAGFGVNNTASGWYSLVAGSETIASGMHSFAMGNRAKALHSAAVALGTRTTASGSASVALGSDTTAEAVGQTTLGYFNTPVAGNASAYIATDRLFVIGNGSYTEKSDALVVLKNGNTTLNGKLTIDGDNQGSGKAYTLPAQDGTSNQILTTDGSGNVSWTTTTGATAVPNYTKATLSAGWQHYNAAHGGTTYEDIRYRKVSNEVRLEGMCVKTTGVNSGDILMVLPTANRPLKQQLFMVITSAGAKRVAVHPNGNVIYDDANFNTGQNYISLSGVSFGID